MSLKKTGLIIRHVPHEGIAEPIEAVGYRLDRIDVGDAGFGAVDLCAPDLLIMMGGPMGVYEPDDRSWISCQLQRLARRIDAGLPTLAFASAHKWPAATVEAGSSAAALDRDHRRYGPGAVVAGRRMIAQGLGALTDRGRL